jgi:hypothetical protein
LVCGRPAVCLRFEATTPEDCVFKDGRFRAIRGTDVTTPEEWIVDEPGTRQDPELRACRAWATDGSGALDDAKLLDCVHQLGAADQRGWCEDGFAGSGNSSDVCEAMN